MADNNVNGVKKVSDFCIVSDFGNISDFDVTHNVNGTDTSVKDVDNVDAFGVIYRWYWIISKRGW